MDPLEYGWVIENDLLAPEWYSEPALPERLVDETKGSNVFRLLLKKKLKFLIKMRRTLPELP